MIIHEENKIEVNIYRCPLCSKAYHKGGSMISCAVMHAPGTCCHYSEKEVSQDQLDKIHDILKEK